MKRNTKVKLVYGCQVKWKTVFTKDKSLLLAFYFTVFIMCYIKTRSTLHVETIEAIFTKG